jgi:hypothetical protein
MNREELTGKQSPGVRGRDHRSLLVLGIGVLGVSLAGLSMLQGQQIHRNGFESRTPGWIKGPADAPYKETLHEITDQTAHTGQLSEHLQLTAEQGSFIHYQYPTAKAPLTDELAARVWIKANRPGVQLLARVVLPRERHPNNLNEPLTAVLRGTQYQLVGRWQPLDIRRPMKLAKEQQQLMRAELKRDVDFTDAYIDQLTLNVWSGPGLTELWIDDLEIGPVVDDPTPPRTAPPAVSVPEARPAAPPERHAIVELHDHLLVNGKRFLFRGIRHTDTPLEVLRDAGFNTVWLDPEASSEAIEEASRLGLWIVPSLPLPDAATATAPADGLQRVMSRFKDRDAVLFWDLGGGKTYEDAALVSRTAQAAQAIDNQRPFAVDIWDGFQPYSRNLGMIGSHRWPLMTGMELPQYRDWLVQRRLLARPGTFQWTWIQTHLPDWYTSLVYEQSATGRDRFDEPIGPQAEQLRLLTYTALASGCQGLAFWSDRFLADSHQGRDRLLAMALINQEIHMLEPLLLSTIDPPTWIDTSHPEIKAAVTRTDRGVLVIPIWLGRGSQYVPGQAAAAQLEIIVPQVPAGAHAWEVTPGDVRSLRMERVAGGTKVIVPEFGLTTSIVFTSDNGPTGLLVRFQEHARRTRKQAARWMHDLAEVELEKVLKVEAELEKAGHVLPDGQALQDDARNRLRSAKQMIDIKDYRQAYYEAQRVLRPLRILMRAQWESAVKQLDTPVASVYAVNFWTLPRHWALMSQVNGPTARIAANVLPDGDFETEAGQQPAAWLPQEVTLDDVTLAAWRVTDEPREGRRCLKLEVKAKNPETPPATLERTFLAINSPAVKLEPGSLVKITGWVRVPRSIAASADGALMYDSAAGEPLAVRVTQATPWRKFTLYRRVPESGNIHVTVALTGIGSVYFDDIRIEPIATGQPYTRPGTGR